LPDHRPRAGRKKLDQQAQSGDLGVRRQAIGECRFNRSLGEIGCLEKKTVFKKSSKNIKSVIRYFPVITLSLFIAVSALVISNSSVQAEIRFISETESTGIRSFTTLTAYHENWIITCTQQTSGRLYSQSGKSCDISLWDGSRVTASGLRWRSSDFGSIRIQLSDRGVRIELNGKMRDRSAFSISCGDQSFQGVYVRTGVGNADLFSSQETPQIIRAMRAANSCVTTMTVNGQRGETRTHNKTLGFSAALDFAQSWMSR
jgi:hypothetical protein